MTNDTSIDRLHAFLQRQAARDEQLQREIDALHARQAALLIRMEANLQASIDALHGRIQK